MILLFLLRPYIVLILSMVNMSDHTGLVDYVYPNKLAMSLGALAGIPAALLVYVWIKRKPGAPQAARKIWARGRAFLGASALLNACVQFVPFWIGAVHTMLPGDWLQFAVALLIVVLVNSSSYIRDFFNDFPCVKVPAEK
jgi:peptidoglycan biosynthesis protein MviN/MurJ (putative lipid II flippase)